MFMPNVEAALREFARVLKPGGHFVATVWQGQKEVSRAASGGWALPLRLPVARAAGWAGC